jgi:hypothetical protein
VKVRVEDKLERTALWTTPNSTVLAKVVAGTGEAGVVGVRKFPSGDILVQIKERAGKESLVRRTKWLQGVAPSARIVPDLYPVLVHGVKVSRINTADQKRAVELLQEQNTKLHGNLRIARVSWPRGIYGSGKVYSSLTIFLASPEAANQVINSGLVESGEVKMCERFMTGCGLVQCFKCCKYGHIAKTCRAEAQCGHCAGLHETRDCKQKEVGSCAICKILNSKKSNHKAWSECCPARLLERSRLQEKLENRPYLYHTAVIPDRRPAVEVPTTKERKPGCPKGSTTAKAKATEGGAHPAQELDPMDVDGRGVGVKRKRQSTLSFKPTEERERESESKSEEEL